MSDSRLHLTPQDFNPQATFDALAKHLHRGGRWAMYFDNDAHTSCYVPTDRPFHPPAAHWLSDRNLFFSVNPNNTHRPPSQAARNADIVAVNALYAEIDGKDFVRSDEWHPHYITPDLDGLRDAQARGALTKAQTAAIDAAYKQAPEVYKARALAHVHALTVRPSVCWASGGGYQMVWLLADTVPVDEENRRYVAHVQREWVHLHGGDPSAVDLRRVLRCPGSVNFKPKYAPDYPVVTFLWADLGLMYDFADLAAMVPPLHERTPAKRADLYIPAGVDLGYIADGELPPMPQHPAVTAYNRATNLRDLLVSYGYMPSANPARLSRPGGDSAGVELHPNNTATIYSSADPLFGRRCTPALAMLVYEHGGAVDAAMDALTDGEWTQKKRTATPAEWDAARDWLWLGGADEELRRNGVRRVDGYLKTMGAMLDHAVKRGGYTTIAPGMRQLAASANCGSGTLSRHLATMFAAGLIDLQIGDAATQTPTVITLNFVHRAQPEQVANVGSDELRCQSEQVSKPALHTCSGYARYREKAVDDAFQGGYRLVWGAPWHAEGPYRKPLPAVAALAWAAFAEAGPMSRRDLADMLGTTASRAAAATRGLAAFGLITQEKIGRSVIYTLADDAEAMLKELRPTFCTFGLADRRRWCNLDYSQKVAERNGQEEKAERLKKQAGELRKRLLAVGVDLAAKGLPVAVPKEQTEHGLAIAGTTEQWAAAYEHARERKADDALAEWMRSLGTKDKKLVRRTFGKALGRAEENWPRFYAWLTQHQGSAFVYMSADAVARRFLEWEKSPDFIVPIRYVDVTGAAMSAD